MKSQPDIEDAQLVENVLGPMPKGNNAFLDLKPIYDMAKPDSGRYRFDQKVEALVHLTAHMDVNDMSLELEPNFHAVAEYLKISNDTLKRWWQERDEILETAGILADQISKASVIKNMVIKQQAQEALLDRDFSETSVKDLVLLLKTLTVMDHISLSGVGNKPKVEEGQRIQFVLPESSG